MKNISITILLSWQYCLSIFSRNNFLIRRKLNKLLVIVLAVFLYLIISVPKAWGEESLILVASRDNTLIENSMGELSNGLGSAFFVGRTNQNSDSIRRGLIAFDIVDQIPAGSTITEVKLILNLERTPSEEESIELHRVLADWGEGSSSTKKGRGAPATEGDATWIHTFYDQDLWSESGGDFDPEASATQIVGDLGTYVWDSESNPEMVQDIQDWLDASATNFGWLLLGDETDSGTVKVFTSRQHDDDSQQPQLKVSFQS